MGTIDRIPLTDENTLEVIDASRNAPFQLDTIADGGTTLSLAAGTVENLGDFWYKINNGSATVNVSTVDEDGIYYILVKDQGAGVASAYLSKKPGEWDSNKNGFYIDDETVDDGAKITHKVRVADGIFINKLRIGTSPQSYRGEFEGDLIGDVSASFELVSEVGRNASNPYPGTPAVTGLGSDLIAFTSTSTDGVVTMKYNKDSWTQVGTTDTFDISLNPEITALSPTSVAINDSFNQLLYKVDYIGTNWTVVGSTSMGGAGGMGGGALAGLGPNRLAKYGESLQELRVYDFNGTDWIQVGNGLSVTLNGCSMAPLNQNTIATVDATTQELRTYAFDGTDWELVGNALDISSTVPIGDPALTSFESNKVLFTDDMNKQLRIFQWDGSNWEQIGNEILISTATELGSVAICSMSSNTFVVTDTSNQGLQKWFGVKTNRKSPQLGVTR